MFGKKVTNTVKPQAEKNLLELNENATQLDKHRSKVFHYVTEELLYVTKGCGIKSKPQ